MSPTKLFWSKSCFGDSARGWTLTLLSRRRAVCEAYIIDQPEKLELAGIYTQPEFRRMGYARQLLESLLRDLCKMKEHRRLELSVEPHGPETPTPEQLIRFYISMGFETLQPSDADTPVVMSRGIL